MMVEFRRLFALGSTRANKLRSRGHLKRDEEEVRRSSLFDADWYFDRYPDVAQSIIEPLRHFMRHGWQELRQPNMLFDTAWYLQHSDVRAEGGNPLLHYIRHGALEHRVTNPAPRPIIYLDPLTSGAFLNLPLPLPLPALARGRPLRRVKVI